ncbi:MAG: lactate racemase domain-containing protein [Eubacteriales bacterium]
MILEKTPPITITNDELYDRVKISVSGKNLKKVLIIPPDYTRLYSGAGVITAMYHEILTKSFGCQVDIMPALGTHVKMSRQEWESFFGKEIPYEKMIVHSWREDVCSVGTVPGEFVREVSEGLVTDDIPVMINRRITDRSYDLIISVGQVVPHEVAGMANYTKNILVGCGGEQIINASHMLGAFYGMERIMGKDFSPVRKVFDYAEEKFLKPLPIMYVLTVATGENGLTHLHGVYIGRSRALFERTVEKSREKNLIHLDRPIKKAVVYLDEKEFKSTWLGNKAIYRTRMAMADGGKLIVIAPGAQRFGEDAENDRLIRKYGYAGRKKVLELVKENPDLKQNLSVAAHLIHGSSDGRFEITYAARFLTKEEIEGVYFTHADFDETVKKYPPDLLKDGFNDVCGEEIFYISNPALGLWIYEEKPNEVY